MLETDNDNDAKLILIKNMDLDLHYVFASSTASYVSDPQQPYVSRPQQPAVCLVRSSRTYLVQQPHVLTRSRTSRLAGVRRVEQPYISPAAAVRLVQQRRISSSSRTSRRPPSAIVHGSRMSVASPQVVHKR